MAALVVTGAISGIGRATAISQPIEGTSARLRYVCAYGGDELAAGR